MSSPSWQFLNVDFCIPRVTWQGPEAASSPGGQCLLPLTVTTILSSQFFFRVLNNMPNFVSFFLKNSTRSQVSILS